MAKRTTHTKALSPKSFWRKRSTLIISIALAILIVLGAKKVIYYGGAPLKDKDCNYIYPDNGDSTAFPNSAATTITLQNSTPFELSQKGGLVNDASCLNKTAIFGIANITSEEDVKNALFFAKEHDLKITTSGQKHSMGGQSFSKNGLILDMRNFNHMKLDKDSKTLIVETGATWAKVQEYLDKEGFSVKAMQSINIFTVGGTLSVNAHGVAHDPGQIAPTVRSMRIMLADGTVVKASPTENRELFSHALGGYGLFGVILDVDLEVVPNEVYMWSTNYMSYKDFPKFFKENIDKNPELGLMYARISLSPLTFLDETAVHTFKKTATTTIPELKTATLPWFSRVVINFSKTGNLGRWFRWTLEKNVESHIHTCISRNQAMSANEVCVIARNQEMYDSMGYLKNRLQDTDILQEYFIPAENMEQFIDGLRETVKKNGANLLNVTIRIVHKDNVTALPYARGDRFAFVLYFNQKFNRKESEILRKTTVDLIDLATNSGGTYYLPYQLFYTKEQLLKAYPEIDTFFATKKKYDKDELFTNKWYEKYSN